MATTLTEEILRFETFSVPGEDKKDEDLFLSKERFIFLIDRSGSMYGNRIQMAKQSLIYFLKSLQENGSKFNIISFGSKFYSLFNENKLINDENINLLFSLIN